MTVSKKIVLNLRGENAYEQGALLLTMLAYPSDKLASDAERDSLYRSLCSWALLNKAHDDPEWAYKPQLMRPIHALRDRDLIDRNLKKFPRLIRDRMAAGKMCLAYLQEAATGQLPPLPDGITRLSLNQLSAMVRDDANQQDPENVEKRIWRPSIPVVHVAAAIQLAMSNAAKKGMRPITLEHLLLDGGVIAWVVSIAELFRSLLGQSTKAPIKPDQLIRFTMVVD